jgi:ribonuclease HI
VLLEVAERRERESDMTASATRTERVVHRQADARKPTIEVYTDGGCRGNPGVGAWAALIYEGPKPKEISGVERQTTNNKMELRAAIEALRAFEKPSKVRLFSDSAYLINCMNEGWYLNWERNGWKNSTKKPVENRELWRELL